MGCNAHRILCDKKHVSKGQPSGGVPIDELSTSIGWGVFPSLGVFSSTRVFILPWGCCSFRRCFSSPGKMFL